MLRSGEKQVGETDWARVPKPRTTRYGVFLRWSLKHVECCTIRIYPLSDARGGGMEWMDVLSSASGGAGVCRAPCV